jgi:predicted outer membrane repeat protein
VIIDMNEAGDGGGCYSTSNSSPVFRRCSFFANTADGRGGAICSELGQMRLETVTIAGNHASDHGAGVYLRYSPADMFAVLIAFNGDTEGVFREGPYAPEFVMCDVYGNAGGDSLPGIVGYGCESVDPLFCDFPAGDLTLCENSLCIRSGPPEGHIGRFGAGCDACSETGVGHGEDAPVADGAVSWASPNPSRGSIRIRFMVPETCRTASLRIYNLRGQLLRTFELEDLTLRGEVEWDGRNDSGARLASGVYFYRMDACGGERRGKLVLLR